MLENSTERKPNQTDLAIYLLKGVDSFAESDDSEAIVKNLKDLKATEPGALFAPFIDAVIVQINEAKAKIERNAIIDAEAIKNNWTPLRKLIARRGFSIASLSKEVGIDFRTLSKHLIDGNFKCWHLRKIAAVLDIPRDKIDHYFFEAIRLRQAK